MPRALFRLIVASVAACTLLLLLSALADGSVAGWQRLLVAAWVVAAAAAPRDTALALVAVIPLAFLGSAVAATPFRMLEALVLASLAGWGVRAGVFLRGGSLPASLATPTLLAATVVACSGIVLLAGVSAPDPAGFRESILEILRHDYLVDRGPLHAAAQAVLQIESLGLFAAAVVFGASPAWVAGFNRMLVAGAAGAALLNIFRLTQIALRSESAWATLGTALGSIRINVSYGDVNAAGSYFALAAVIALGSTLFGLTSHPWTFGGATVLTLLAAWMTGSRAAVAAILFGCVLLLVLRVRNPAFRRSAIVGFAACAVATLVFVMLFPNRLTGSGASVAWLVRTEMARISLAMLNERPLFGVGVGNFFETSARFLPSSRLAEYYVRENAHNNVLQVIAEVGLAGAMIFAWLAVEAIRRYARTVAATVVTPSTVLVVAVTAFAATMLFGHPLLTPEVCYVFALAAGTAAAASPATPSGQRSERNHAIVAVVVAAALMTTLPYRVQKESASANLAHVAWGVGPWQTDETGERYRTMEGSVTLFVPTHASLVELPYRLARDGPAVTLLVTYRGRPAAELIVDSTIWRKYRMLIPPGGREARFEPIQLKAVAGEPAQVRLGKLVEY